MTIKNYGAVSSIEELEEFIARVMGTVTSLDIESGYYGDDREKGAIHRSTAIIVGISFTNSTDWARYVPLAHDNADNLDGRRVAQLFWDLVQTGLTVAHNYSFELRHLSKWFLQELADDPERGEQVRASKGYFPIRSDSMVEAYLVAEYPSFGLKYLSKEMFGHTQTELHELFGEDFKVKNRKYMRFNTLELTPQVINYACEDSVWCLGIHQRYYEMLQQERSLLFTVEKSIVQDVLPLMEDEGVLYDWQLMRRTADILRDFRDRFNAEIMAELSELAGRPVAINLASPLQVRKTLYEGLGMKTTVFTDKTRDLEPDKRVMSTSDIALRKLVDKFPVVKRILQWREQTKLLGTYLDKYETAYNIADDGRAHPSLLSAFVITGRFACSDPNYQQCLPGSYEVLTPDGWERLDKLADGTPVAQYHNNQSIGFATPEAVIRNPYDGDMVEIDAGRTGRWRYTPNHRIVYRTRAPRGDRVLSDIKEMTAEEWERQLASRPVTLPFGRHFNDRYVPCAGWTNQPRWLTDEWVQNLRLAVAIQADGSHTNGHQYDICVYKDRKVQALRELGLEPQQYPDGRWRVRIPDQQVSAWLDENKNFKPDMILKLHQDDLSVFLDEVMVWDGDSSRGARYGQKTTRRQSVDVVQAAAALIGRATSLYEDPEADHVWVNVHPRPHRDSGYQVIKRVPSDGMVYCVTVPTGMFLVRNDEGHVQVTGNSPKKYHFDLDEAKLAHAAGETPPPATCFKFNFRDVIKAPEDHYILGFDLSQAELRAIAGEAQEHALLDAFENGEDVHRVTASLMLGVPLAEVTDDMRAVGKAQPLDAGIMTPTGPRRMGDLQVGDFVIGSDGYPTKVTGVFPQGEKEIFRVTSSDGATTECCGEHLWTVQNINIPKAKRKWVTRELGRLVASGLTRGARSNQSKYQIPDRQVIHFDQGAELPIDPYVLGALLGDGGFTHSWGPSFGSADQELLDAVRAEHERQGGRWASETETSPGFRVAYLAAGIKYRRGTNKIKDALRELGLWGHRDFNKFVPDVYRFASPQARLAMLQGLLDTDGTVQASGALFRVTSRPLAEAAQFLARSLGGWASLKSIGIKKTEKHMKSEGRETWIVYLRLPQGMCPFRLTRKIAKWKEPVYKAQQTITAVESVGVKEAQCISVAADDGLYLSENGHYTHNTLNFALLYGMSTKGLADRLAIPIEEAQSLMDKYFAGLSAIASYMAKMVRLGKEQGYVTSKFGRKLPIWEYLDERPFVRSKGDRACVNYPIQGAATGDYMKIAMVRAVAAIKKAGLLDKIKLVMNVHDALEFYVHISLTPEEVVAILRPAVVFEVPGWPVMKADWHIAKRWGSPTDIEVHPDGSITAKGAMPEEIKPFIEVDEDGNESVVLPEVDTAVLREVARVGGRQVVIVLKDMPTNNAWDQFKDFVAKLPGGNRVSLVTPEGDIELPFETGLSPAHLGAVGQLMPGARVEFVADHVEHLAAGLSL